MNGGERDSLRRFVFEKHSVRGELIHLNRSVQTALATHDYDATTAQILGEALGAVALLTAILKFKGRLTLQLQSDGPLRLLVAQCSDRMHVRGLAHADALDGAGEGAPPSLQSLAHNGRVVMTIEPDEGQRYQGIVPLEGDSLGGCLEHYFARSEQLPTRLWLHAAPGEVFGMLLQKLPDGEAAASDDDAWNRLTLLADTLTEQEMHQLTDEQILHRLYHEEDVRLFDREPVSFRCSCTRERVGDAIRGLGRADAEALLREEGQISTTCEFCNRAYDFDGVDVTALFEGMTGSASSTQH